MKVKKCNPWVGDASSFHILIKFCTLFSCFMTNWGWDILVTSSSRKLMAVLLILNLSPCHLPSLKTSLMPSVH